MRSVIASKERNNQLSVMSSRASASNSARNNIALKKVTTLPAARYGPGEARTLATAGRLRARSRSSLTPASAGRLLNCSVSLICPLGSSVPRSQARSGNRPATPEQKCLAIYRVQCNASPQVEREFALRSPDQRNAPPETAQNREIRARVFAVRLCPLPGPKLPKVFHNGSLAAPSCRQLDEPESGTSRDPFRKR